MTLSIVATSFQPLQVRSFHGRFCSGRLLSRVDRLFCVFLVHHVILSEAKNLLPGADVGRSAILFPIQHGFRASEEIPPRALGRIS